MLFILFNYWGARDEQNNRDAWNEMHRRPTPGKPASLVVDNKLRVPIVLLVARGGRGYVLAEVLPCIACDVGSAADEAFPGGIVD